MYGCSDAPGRGSAGDTRLPAAPGIDTRSGAGDAEGREIEARHRPRSRHGSRRVTPTPPRVPEFRTRRRARRSWRGLPRGRRPRGRVRSDQAVEAVDRGLGGGRKPAVILREQVSGVGRAGIEPATLGLKVFRTCLNADAPNGKYLQIGQITEAGRCGKLQRTETGRYSIPYSKSQVGDPTLTASPCSKSNRRP